MNAELKKALNETRASILHTCNAVHNLRKHPSIAGSSATLTDTENAARGECHANLMLSIRHLEDARMRLGKAIQSMEGGESIYDKQPEGPYPG